MGEMRAPAVPLARRTPAVWQAICQACWCVVPMGQSVLFSTIRWLLLIFPQEVLHQAIWS